MGGGVRPAVVAAVVVAAGVGGIAFVVAEVEDWPVVKVKAARQTRMTPKTFILSSFAVWD